MKHEKKNIEGLNHSSLIHHLLEAETARPRSNHTKLSFHQETRPDSRVVHFVLLK